MRKAWTSGSRQHRRHSISNSQFSTTAAMSVTSLPCLPAAFKSLYRLHLRTVSAAVMHHKGATRNLRRLWRPTFDDGARVTQELLLVQGGRKNSESPPGPENAGTAQLENWLNEWNNRGGFIFFATDKRNRSMFIARFL